jgi:hypothetical protein
MCDFSFLWVRLAYMWLFQQGQPDLSLLGEISSIQRDKDGICPNFNMEDTEVKKGGKPAVTRTWYSLRDPKTGSLVEEMTACSDCVAHINIIFPCLKRIFAPVADGQALLATCDLMTQGNGQQRCLEYVDKIASVAEITLETKTRDVTPLIDFVKKWAPVPVCQKGNSVKGEKQYCLSSMASEFTACEDCYLKHVERSSRSSGLKNHTLVVSCVTSTLPAFRPTSQTPAVPMTCQLFGRRFRHETTRCKNWIFSLHA